MTYLARDCYPKICKELLKSNNENTHNLLGEAVRSLKSFYPHFTAYGWTLGLKHCSLREKSPHSLCPAYHCGWGQRSLFQVNEDCLCLKNVHHMAPGKPHCFICPPRQHCGNRWKRPTGHRGPVPTIEADLALSHLQMSKVWLLPVLDCAVFLGNSDTEMQWAALPGLLFLVFVTVVILTILHAAGVLPWDQ